MKMKFSLLICLAILNATCNASNTVSDKIKSDLLTKIDEGNQKVPSKVLVVAGFLKLEDARIAEILRDIIDILFKVNGSVSLKTPAWQNAISKTILDRLSVSVTPNGNFITTDNTSNDSYGEQVEFKKQFGGQLHGIIAGLSKMGIDLTKLKSKDEISESETLKLKEETSQSETNVTPRARQRKITGFYTEPGKTLPIETGPIEITSYHIFVYDLMTTMRNDISSIAGIIDRKSRDGFENSANARSELEHIVELIEQLQTYLAIIEKFLKVYDYVAPQKDDDCREKHSLLDKLGDMYLYQSECKSGIARGKDIISKFAVKA